MPLELLEMPKHKHGNKLTVETGDRGFLILAKVRVLRNVHREALKKLKAIAELYFKEKCPELEVKDDGDDESDTEPVKKENGTDGKGTLCHNASEITFQPYDVYDNCTFFLSNLPDPSDFAYFFFSQLADHPDWPQPKFPLRVMPVQVVCKLQVKAIQNAIRPMLEEKFGGDDSIRFSFILHTRKPSSDMTLHEAEAIIRNCLWSINPNCVQCLKYQDYAIMVEIAEPLLLVGVARHFNTLGRYNSATVVKGRDLKDKMEDSEDDISDDPNLSEEGNIRRKLDIKRKRRQQRAEEARIAKQQAKANNEDNDNEEVEVKEEELDGEDD